MFLVDEKTHEFVLEKTTPQHMEDVCNQEVAYQIECNMFSWIINRRKPAIIPSFHFKEEKTIIMLPLSTVKRTMGVILALTPLTESMITQENLKLLSMLARQCSLVMENAMLYSRVRKKHDALQMAQAKLIQSEKLASIGRLTAGASHEILNPLSIISGHIQLLSMKREFEPDIQKPLDAIKIQTDRIENIIKGLAQFSRYSASDKKWIGINEVIRKFFETADEKTGKRFQIQQELDSSDPKIMGSEKSLTHLLSFLLSNAVDAIDDNGMIKIKTYLTKEFRRDG